MPATNVSREIKTGAIGSENEGRIQSSRSGHSWHRAQEFLARKKHGGRWDGLTANGDESLTTGSGLTTGSYTKNPVATVRRFPPNNRFMPTVGPILFPDAAQRFPRHGHLFRLLILLQRRFRLAVHQSSHSLPRNRNHGQCAKQETKCRSLQQMPAKQISKLAKPASHGDRRYGGNRVGKCPIFMPIYGKGQQHVSRIFEI